MTEREFENFKSNYESIQREQKKLLDEKEEYESLKNDPLVKRYLELETKLTTYDTQDFLEMSKSRIVERAYSLAKVTNTKTYYYLAGYFKPKYDYDIVHGSSEERCDFNDPDMVYGLYRSLETLNYSSGSEVMIRKSDVKKFEEAHYVIKDFHRNVYSYRYEFWIDILDLGYLKACERLEEKCCKN